MWIMVGHQEGVRHAVGVHLVQEALGSKPLNSRIVVPLHSAGTSCMPGRG
jgi:hypothetical protein